MRNSDPLRIRLLTHNIRYATSAPFEGEELWEIRKPRLINELRFNTAQCPESFICLQEVLHQQLLDVLSGLNTAANEWAYIGVGRDDGHQGGEYSPIFYQPAIWALQSYKCIWLSETPNRPSRGWDAASVRILTIGVFQHRGSKKRIVAMNTHLDDQGSRSRLEAARIILEQVTRFMDQSDGHRTLPVFVAGDFNSEPDDEAYKAMTGINSAMCDMQLLVPESARYGNLHTFTGFTDQKAVLSRIDFIFINHSSASASFGYPLRPIHPVDHWLAEGYSVLENRFEDGVFNSDHRAVIGDVALQ